MPDVCTVSGTLRDLEGDTLPYAKVVFTRTGVVGQYGDTIVPRHVEKTAGPDGGIAVNLYPGNYIALTVSNGKAERFTVSVPEAAGALLSDIIDAASVPITPDVVIAAQAARDAAVAARDEAEELVDSISGLVGAIAAADRPALKGVNTAAVAVAVLKEPGREGVFVWKAGNYTTQIAADPSEGIYVKADAIAATAGAWVRQYSGAVNAKWFGAKGDDATDDTGAIQAMLNLVSGACYIPPGTYRHTGLSPKANQTISGAGTSTRLKYVAVAPFSGAPVLYFSGITGSGIRDLLMEIPIATYADVRAFDCLNCTDCWAENISFDGGGGIVVHIATSQRCRFSNFLVDELNKNGFTGDSCSDILVDGWQLIDCSDGENGIQFTNGHHNTVTNCLIRETPDNQFGIYMLHEDEFDLRGNRVEDTRREAIAIGGNSIGGKVLGNTLIWETNLGTGDFGMSVQGTDASNIVADLLIQGNTIINAALDGIGLAGFCQRITATNNIIRDCARAAASGFQSGIKLYCQGAFTICEHNLIADNYVSQVLGAGMLYAVSEASPAGNNHIRGNHTFGLSGNQYVLASASGSRLIGNSNDANLRTANLTVTAGSGTITTATASINYQFDGRFVKCRLVVNITTNGTGASNVTVSGLPFAVAAGMLTGKESAINGKMIAAGIASSTSLSITAYDNTYPGGSGAALILTGILELSA